MPSEVSEMSVDTFFGQLKQRIYSFRTAGQQFFCCTLYAVRKLYDKMTYFYIQHLTFGW